MRKFFTRSLLTATILATTLLSVSALSAMQTTTFTMNDTVISDVLLGNDAIHSDESVTSMIDSTVVSAINGGFFNAYYSGNSYPSNCPLIYGTIVDDGLLINGGDTTNLIGFTYDGDTLIDRVKIVPAYILNGTHSINFWSVNQLKTDADAIVLMTDLLPYSYTAPSGFTVVTITGETVTAVSSSGTYTVADGTSHLLFGSGALARCQTWGYVPSVGDTVQFTHTYDNEQWNDVKTAVTGGRMLVQDGVNVTANSFYNANFDSDQSQSNTSSLGRSFAALMSDGSTLFGTATGTFPEIASYLIGQGAVDAISLDGGGSSMLYTQNEGYLTSAGRPLASVLAIKTGSATAVAKPEVTEIPDNTQVDADAPSDWAVEAIQQCTDLNLVRSWMSYGYQNDLTREEFCSMLLQFIMTSTGQAPEDIIYSIGNQYGDFSFTDTDSYQIRCIAAMEIVDGQGDGTFDPTGLLTREQSATMILRMVNLLGTAPQVTTATFADQDQISDWAVDGVAAITGAKIMNGDGTNFNPQDHYTKEEGYVTIFNVYNQLEISSQW